MGGGFIPASGGGKCHSPGDHSPVIIPGPGAAAFDECVNGMLHLDWFDHFHSVFQLKLLALDKMQMSDKSYLQFLIPLVYS